MPQYREALAGIENDTARAGAASQDAGGSFAGMGADAAGAAGDIEELTDAMREQRSEAIRAANAEIGYQAALDDARKSIKENGKHLEITPEKGRATKTALLDVAAAWTEPTRPEERQEGTE